jgi:hypothetical protein
MRIRTRIPGGALLGVVALAAMLLAMGCSTRGSFVLPAGTEVEIYERPAVTPDASGQIEMAPFFWTAVAGVPYRLVKNGQTVKEGKIRARFRVVSIFWPPLALIYWPVGFSPDITHDLSE